MEVRYEKSLSHCFSKHFSPRSEPNPRGSTTGVKELKGKADGADVKTVAESLF